MLWMQIRRERAQRQSFDTGKLSHRPGVSHFNITMKYKRRKKCKCVYSFKTGNWRETVGTALKMMSINACIVFSFPKDFHRQVRQNQMLARLNISTQTHRRFGVMKTDTPGSDIRAKMLPPCHSLACLGETQLKLGVAVRKATCAMGPMPSTLLRRNTHCWKGQVFQVMRKWDW